MKIIHYDSRKLGPTSWYLISKRVILLEYVDIYIFILVVFIINKVSRVLIYHLIQEYVYDVVNFKFRRKKISWIQIILWDNSDRTKEYIC